MPLRRWSDDEQKFLDELRGHKDVAAALVGAKNVQDIVGDRRLLRFSRGHGFVLETVAKMYVKHLEWRKERNVDAVRDDILYGGKDHPSKFPHAEPILKHVKQVIISPEGTDNMGSPLCVENYSFSPSEVLQDVTIEQYIEFMTYSLEYKVLITEQIAEHKERAFLKDIEARKAAGETIDEDELPPYGVIVHTVVIRDMVGVGMEHLGTNGQNILRAIIGLSSDNYPELMKKCYMINTPWVFNTLWYFIKGLLAQRTIDKVSVVGSSFLEELQATIPLENIPNLVPGGLRGEEAPYVFDESVFVRPEGDAKAPQTVFMGKLAELSETDS